MDLFDELENLAVAAVYEEPDDDDDIPHTNKGTIKMWQDRFGYTYEEAAAVIGITQNATKPSTLTQQATLSPAQARAVYLLRLNGPISTPQRIQIAANLETIPESHHGSSVDVDAVFCKVDGRTKIAIESWLSNRNGPLFRPLFIPVKIAYKELSSHSLYPTLGKDTTLPQFRPQDSHLLSAPHSFGRTQNQFPVWYFFYGTLDSVPKLCSLISFSGDDIPILYDASVMGGRMETWGNGKYKALVNGSERSCVKGSAYQVMSEEHEDALRKYETDAYEVVRCLIKIDGTAVPGCTFRFIGETD
ncbi:hypothetical protein V499_08789 [Pseudogymnoascus sp. VKM F-103]|uniref:Putative gamma-glutamylcyclotransferase n=1 Tax=Pseudogymnoascus verrucosus TaxID=342668 RepID=A0A1B8GSR8_9PEZI|nr:uncharacterized protein VE01_03296 [Pseudogymnoascus verrucosus]KFY70976.1 hypothetical protein V499_08789 [Pseudogymnoascus sp. VKM F-103]OBT98871.1 hypothetical protein VE01_03296 [Pseudogymnoascus verrucosus]